MSKVGVLLSGGIDSSLALYLLKKEGYEVEAFSLIFHPESTCCTRENIEKARLLCKKLSVRFETVEVVQEFERCVVSTFIQAYLIGTTPNPCIYCNRDLKFGLFLHELLKNGYKYLASGHYARIIQKEEDKQYQLLKGVDVKKDQSYMLFYLNRNYLQNILFPLGNLTKNQVFNYAMAVGIWGGEKKESQDVCFIKGSLSKFFMERNIPLSEGPIMNLSGEIIGRHKGVPLYTIGQREGLGISSAKPLYVIRMDPVNNCLIVGEREQVLKSKVVVKDLNWLSMSKPDKEFLAMAKARYGMVEKPARITPVGEEVEVNFFEPQFALTPGQAIVFYQDEILLGGGVIKEVIS